MTKKTQAKASPLGRTWDWPAALFLAGAVLLAARRLTITEWTEELARVQPLALLGVVLGLALGYSRFRTWLVVFLSCAYGALFLPWQLGLTMGVAITWPERLNSLWGRLQATFETLLQGQTVNDPLLFLVLVFAAIWALGLAAGYQLTRRGDAWSALLPTGIGIVVIQTYDTDDPARALYIAIYLLAALLLVSRVAQLERQAQWRQNNSYIPLYAGGDVLRAALFIALILLVFSWGTPALASAIQPVQDVWDKITKPFQNLQDRLNQAFNTLEGRGGVFAEYYGEILPLGLGNPRSDEIIFTVDSQGLRPPDVRFHWLVRVYDHYEDGRWEATTTQSQQHSPDDLEAPLPLYNGRWYTRVSITTNTPLATLIVVPQTYWVSRPTRWQFRPNADGSFDITSFQTEETIRKGESYAVEAGVTDATIAELRAAGTDYPQWVVERYLQLPENITPRTQALAQEIAQDLENPYDIAAAVTQYLRRNIEYSDTIPIPPEDREPLDWMLFDLQQGFCNYYASAEVILLRSLGIPARLAVGYAQGTRIIQETLGGISEASNEVIDEDYIIRQRDAHAWPEVYFPNIGWVEFEPTVSQFAITRAPGDPELAALQPLDPSDLPEPLESELDFTNQEPQAETLDQPASPARNTLIVLLAITAVVLALLLAWRMQKSRRGQPLPVLLEEGFQRLEIRPPKTLRRWAHRALLPPLERAYLEINKSLSRLGQPPGSQDTPAERAVALESLLPNHAADIEQLLQQYQNKTYSQHTADTEQAVKAARTIRTASWRKKIIDWLESLRDKRPQREARL